MVCGLCGDWIDQPSDRISWYCLGHADLADTSGWRHWSIDRRGWLWVCRCQKCLLLEHLRQLANCGLRAIPREQLLDLIADFEPSDDL